MVMIGIRGKKENATLADVAGLAGVSISATSKALLGGGGKTTKVSETTASRIREAAQVLGYHPNSAARQLKTGKSNIIGAIIHSEAPHVYYARFAKIQQRLAKMGYCFMVGQSDGSVELIERYLDEFRSRKADVIISAFFDAPGKTKRLKQIYSGLRNVLYMGRPDFNNASYVEPNTRDGIVQIVNYLVTKGIKRAAIDIVDKFYRPGKMRVAGYLEGMRKNGLPLDESLIIKHDGDLRFVSATVRQALDRGARAIIASNDLRAVMIIKELKRLKINVPDEMRVTGFDNMEFAAFSSPALTTIDPRDDEIAAAAIAMIKCFLAEKRFPENIVIKPDLVIRESA